MMYCEKNACKAMREMDIFVDCDPAQIEPLKGRARIILNRISTTETILTYDITKAFSVLSEALKEREERINETGN